MAVTPTSLVRKKVKLIGLLRDCAKHLEAENQASSPESTDSDDNNFATSSPGIILLYQTLGLLHEHTGMKIEQMQSQMKRSVQEFHSFKKQQAEQRQQGLAEFPNMSNLSTPSSSSSSQEEVPSPRQKQKPTTTSATGTITTQQETAIRSSNNGTNTTTTTIPKTSSTSSVSSSSGRVVQLAAGTSFRKNVYTVGGEKLSSPPRVSKNKESLGSPPKEEKVATTEMTSKVSPSPETLKIQTSDDVDMVGIMESSSTEVQIGNVSETTTALSARPTDAVEQARSSKSTAMAPPPPPTSNAKSSQQQQQLPKKAKTAEAAAEQQATEKKSTPEQDDIAATTGATKLLPAVSVRDKMSVYRAQQEKEKSQQPKAENPSTATTIASVPQPSQPEKEKPPQNIETAVPAPAIVPPVVASRNTDETTTKTKHHMHNNQELPKEHSTATATTTQVPPRKDKSQVKKDLLKTLGQLRADIQEAADTISSDDKIRIPEEEVEENNNTSIEEKKEVESDNDNNDGLDELLEDDDNNNIPSTKLTKKSSPDNDNDSDGELDAILEDNDDQTKTKNLNDASSPPIMEANEAKQLYELSSLLDEEVVNPPNVPPPPMEDICERGAIEVLLEVNDDETIASTAAGSALSPSNTTPLPSSSKGRLVDSENSRTPDSVKNSMVKATNLSQPSTNKALHDDDDDSNNNAEKDDTAAGYQPIENTKSAMNQLGEALKNQKSNENAAIVGTENSEDASNDSYLDWIVGKQCSS